MEDTPGMEGQEGTRVPTGGGINCVIPKSSSNPWMSIWSPPF